MTILHLRIRVIALRNEVFVRTWNAKVLSVAVQNLVATQPRSRLFYSEITIICAKYKCNFVK